MVTAINFSLRGYHLAILASTIQASRNKNTSYRWTVLCCSRVAASTRDAGCAVAARDAMLLRSSHELMCSHITKPFLGVTAQSLGERAQ